MRPLVPEDLFAFRFVTDVQLSPDGRSVAYVVKVADRERDTYRSALWIVDFDGGEPRQITAGERQDMLPRWSPDGRRIAFVSDRGEVPEGKERAPRNVFVLDLAGGEARQLTRFDHDVHDLAWSPDGRTLCAVAKPRRPEGESEPVIRVYDTLRYKADEGGLFDLRRKHLWLVPLDGSGEIQLTDGDWDDLHPAWSADGKWIAFASNRTDDRDRNTVTDVWIVPSDGRGSARRLTESDGPNERPSFAPDGSAVAYYGHRDPRAHHARNIHLWVRSLRDGSTRDVLEGWDRTVGSVAITDMRGLVVLPEAAWSPDGKALYFIGSDRGSANLYAVAAAGGTPTPVTEGRQQVVTASFDASRRRYAALVATATEPGDVYAGELGGRMRRLTNVNAELLGEVYVAEPERIAFGGADGWEIEGWVLKPPGFDPARRHPLILQIHGGPHTAYGYSFFHEFQALAGAGYVVLYTNPRGSHSYGQRFVGACVGDWGGKDYLDLMSAVDHLIELGYVDDRRMGVTGGSYGGFMTNWIIGHTPRFAAAVTARSVSNNLSSFGTSDIGWHFWEYEMGDADPYQDPERYLRFSPISYARNVTTPLLILHAENDYRCPIEQAEQLFVAMKYHGKTVRFVRYPKDNHDLTRGGKPSNRVHHMTSLIGWFDRYLGAAVTSERRREETPAAAS